MFEMSILEFFGRMLVYTFISLFLLRAVFNIRINQIDKLLKLKYPIAERIICGIITVLIAWFVLIPSIRDIPYIIKGNYKVVQGLVTNINKIGSRGITYNSEIIINGDTINFFGNTAIKKYKRYKVLYLPHTKWGISYEKL